MLSAQRPAPRTLRVTLIWALAGCACAGPSLDDLARHSLSQLDGVIVLHGLEQPVEVLRDRWGIAHIYARTVDDLFFAQGFVAAQDRMWQMELWRRAGEGRLAEIAGPDVVARDRLARLLRYRGDMHAEWTSYHPEGERIITAFVLGVNAFIAHRGDRLPVEFVLTGVRPEPWTPDVPLLRMAGLPMTGDALADLRLATWVAEHGPDEANRRDAPDPQVPLRVPDGLDVSAVAPEARAALAEGYAPLPRIPVLPRYRGLVAAAERDTATAAGSNNWVVAGALTATGKPILANDPHRRISLPSLRYLVHLNGPGWNVIGAGEPALPGVAIGHNERIAWGLTVVGIDQQDVFIERVNPANPHEVWWRDGWEPLAIVTDTIRVRGEAPRIVELAFGRHGPVVYRDPVRHLAYALRSVLAEPGTAGYLGSLRLNQARDWDEFLAALDAWKVPSENMIYADVDGNIGWQAAGLTPIRCCGWHGRLPAPGTGRYAWRGFRPMRELPRAFNPARGFIATANHNIMPPGYAPPLGYRWASPRRYRRIVDVLSDSGGFTVEDFQRLQHDVFSSEAWKTLPLLRGWTADDPVVDRARALLAEWDAVLRRDSPAAALYNVWRALVDSTAIGDGSLTAPRRAAVHAVLRDAVARLEAEQGADWSAWRWGAMHRTRFAHPVTAAFDLPAVERDGDRTTVNVTGQHGASFREIIDLADWDRSVATSAPGQSGEPASPYYDNLLPLWARGEYFPLVFSREAVERETAHRLVLTPPGR